MGLLLNNAPGRAGSGGAQEITLIVLPGTTFVLELRVDGADAGAGDVFEVKSNGAPIVFEKHMKTTTGADPDILAFRSPGGFATEGTFTLTVSDRHNVERIRATVHVVADPNALPRPPRPWMNAVREGGKSLAMGILPIVGAGALAWLTFLGCLWAYRALESKYCNACPAPPITQAAPAPGKKPLDPRLVACCQEKLADDKK